MFFMTCGGIGPTSHNRRLCCSVVQEVIPLEEVSAPA